MGSPNTLASFVKYGLENGGTDDNMLILWDHGGGPMLGYGLDEVYGDILTIDEIDSALQSAGIGGDNRLSLLGFDACLMGAVETANKLKDRAEYIVFSQETEPGFGWNYMFLKELENTMIFIPNCSRRAPICIRIYRCLVLIRISSAR